VCDADIASCLRPLHAGVLSTENAHAHSYSLRSNDGVRLGVVPCRVRVCSPLFELNAIRSAGVCYSSEGKDAQDAALSRATALAGHLKARRVMLLTRVS